MKISSVLKGHRNELLARIGRRGQQWIFQPT